MLKLANSFINKYDNLISFAETHEEEVIAVSKGKLKKIFAKLAKATNDEELANIAFRSNFPGVDFSEEAKDAINSCQIIVSAINYLNNEFDNVLIQRMVAPLAIIVNEINKLVESSGTDKWGVRHSKFFSLHKIYDEAFTVAFSYGEDKRVNPLAKRERIDSPFGRLTKTIAEIGRDITKSGGALDVIRKLKEKGIISGFGSPTKEEAEELINSFGIGQRSTNQILNESKDLSDLDSTKKPLLDHEKEILLRKIGDVIGLFPDIKEWNKYINYSDSQQNPNRESIRLSFKDLSTNDLMRHIFRSSLTGHFDSRLISEKISEVKHRLANVKKDLNKKELERLHQMLPQNITSAPPMPFKPKRFTNLKDDERDELIERLREQEKEERKLQESAEELQDLKRGE